jgi:hypothetical protein
LETAWLSFLELQRFGRLGPEPHFGRKERRCFAKLLFGRADLDRFCYGLFNQRVVINRSTERFTPA